jgi:hypothetical protein
MHRLASSAEKEATAAEQQHHQHNDEESFCRHAQTLRLALALRNGVFTPLV